MALRPVVKFYHDKAHVCIYRMNDSTERVRMSDMFFIVIIVSVNVNTMSRCWPLYHSIFSSYSALNLVQSSEKKIIESMVTVS